MFVTAQLILNDHIMYVELNQSKFYQSTDQNGHHRHTLPTYAQLFILMNTPTDNFILELMMKTEGTPTTERQLEIYEK